MQSVKILFIITIVLIILAAVMSAALSGGGDIHEAAKSGDLEVVKRLIDKDPSLADARNESGSTPLHLAAAYGHAGIVEFLIEKGSDVDARNNALATPLRYASVRNQLETARLLLEAGADTEIPDDYGRGPLLICARETGDVEMARLLLDHGADVDAVDRFGDTPIVLAAWRGFEDQVDLFIDRGAGTPLDGRQGRQLVEYSVGKGLERLFRVLDAKGADFTEPTETGWTKLHSAAKGGSVEITAILLERGLDPDARDIYGYTPLHYAAKRGRTDAAKLLISSGASMEEMTAAGDTPWNLASYWKHPEAAAALESAGASSSPPVFPKLEGQYFGLEPPGTVPVIFSAGIASTCDSEHGCITFAPSGDEAYWSTSFMLKDTGYSTGSLFGMRRVDGRWTKPEMTPFSDILDHDGDVPVFSPDGGRLYFISRRDPESGERGNTERIWYVDRRGGGWSEARLVKGIGDEMDVHWQFSVTADGTIYFGGRGPDSRGMGDIYISRLSDGAYQVPVNVGEPVNTEAGEGSPYVTPDGSLMLFSSIGRDGDLGGSDIYVCRRLADGKWSDPVNPGEPVNSAANDHCPMISPDGKFLFFISSRGQTSDIWWVDASVLDGIR